MPLVLGVDSSTQSTKVEVRDADLKSIGADLDIVRMMLKAQANQMNFISNDEALSLNIRVWDDKRNQLVEPEQVMGHLDRSRTAKVLSS